MPTQFLHIIDILGTVAFAVSGAFLAMEKKLDPFGVLVLSFVTAIGGGTLRDILIGNMPVNWLKDESVSVVILLSAITTMIFGRFLKHLLWMLLLFDALGLGLFTIVGLKLGMEKGLSPGICIALGTITACFGGVVRDVLLNDIPLLFRKEIYAMACILGGVLYFLLKNLAIDTDLVLIISIFSVFSIRLIAVKYNLSLPLLYNKFL